MDPGEVTTESPWQGTPEGARLKGMLSDQETKLQFACGYWREDDAAAFEAWARTWLGQIIGHSPPEERTFNVEVI